MTLLSFSSLQCANCTHTHFHTWRPLALEYHRVIVNSIYFNFFNKSKSACSLFLNICFPWKHKIMCSLLIYEIIYIRFKKHPDGFYYKSRDNLRIY